MPRPVLVLLILASIPAFAFGVLATHQQHIRIATFDAVDGQIVAIERGLGGVPTGVRYAYVVDEQVYEGHAILPAPTPLDDPIGRLVAYDYRADMQVPVRVNPKQPRDVYLIAEYSYAPYLLTLLPLWIAMLSLWRLLAWGPTLRRPAAPQAIETSTARELVGRDARDAHDGWFEIGQMQRPSRSMRAGLIGGVGLYAAAFPFIAHYFAVVPSVRFDAPPALYTMLLGAVSLAPIGAGAVAAVRSILFGDPRLLISPAAPRAGQPLRVGVGIPTKNQVTADEIVVTVLARDGRQYTERARAVVGEGMSATDGGSLRGTTELKLPRDLAAERLLLAIEIQRENQPPHISRFPISLAI